MKPFLISKPPKGGTTCPLHAQYYQSGHGRGQKTYLGSVNISADPADLPSCINLRPGVVLDDWQVDEVRVFLLRYGTFREPPKLKPEVLARVRTQVRDEVERELQAKRPMPLEAAVLALTAAGDFVAREAAHLRAAGVKLSAGMVSSLMDEVPADATALDALKVKSNQVRAAVRAFEAALKSAALMKTVARGTTKRRRT